MRRIFVPYGENEAYQGMDGLQRKRLIQRHEHSFSEFGYSPESLHWGSRGTQKVRFKALAEIGISEGDSLLDVGCGFADLYSWLKGNDITVAYTGIDLSPDILGRGIELNPELNLLQGEVFDFDWPPQSFDWVFLSGTLNWDLGDNGDYARRVIARMFSLCRRGVAFNMLDSLGLDPSLVGQLIAFEPDEIMAFCRAITPDCQLRSDYLSDDFTIYMHRS